MAQPLIHPYELFNDARHLDPQARTAYLDEACAGNVELRQKVESLLSAYDSAAGFLETSPVGLNQNADPLTLLLPPCTVIGRYKLMEPIGEGSYGVVFMAE